MTMIAANCMMTSCIDHRNVWLYGIGLDIGDIYIVDYEQKDFAIKRTIIDQDKEKAMRIYKKRCSDMVNGKI